MDSDQPATLIEHFSILEDPRDPGKRPHRLIDMVVIAIAAVICGASDLANTDAFGKAKIEWFRRFLDLDNGIPLPRHLRAGVRTALAEGLSGLFPRLGRVGTYRL
jgi:hypothetical protein